MANVDRMHEPVVPIKRPKKKQEKKLKNGNNKIQKYIKIFNQIGVIVFMSEKTCITDNVRFELTTNIFVIVFKTNGINHLTQLSELGKITFFVCCFYINKRVKHII